MSRRARLIAGSANGALSPYRVAITQLYLLAKWSVHNALRLASATLARMALIGVCAHG